MKTCFTRYILYLVFVCLCSCAKEEEFPKALQHPYLEMQQAFPDSTGIKASAIILYQGENAPTEYGFAYKPQSGDQQSEARVSATMADNKFSAVLSARLTSRITYEVRAYAVVDDKTIYSPYMEATSFVTSPPTITDFSPKEGPDHTQITITGFNFSKNKYEMEVFVGPVRANVLSSDDNKLVVRISGSKHFGSFPIQVKRYKDKIGVSEETFRIWGPEIHKMSKLEATPGDTLTLFGKHLFGGQWGPYVRHGLMQFKVLSAFDTKLLVEVPFPDPAEFDTPLPLTVTAGEKTASIPFSFTIRSNFSSATALDLPVQSSYMPAFEADGKGYFFDYNRVISYSTATGQWREESKFPGLGRSTPLWQRVGDKAYLIGGTKGFYNYGDVWEYDFRSGIWKEKPGLKVYTSRVASFVLDGKIYFAGGTSNESSYILRRYDPQTEQFTTLNRVPGYVAYGSAFSQNGKGYLLVNGSVMEYNQATDSWSVHSQYSASDSHAFTTDGSDVYLLTQRQYPTLYRYNTSTKSWEKAAFYPGCVADQYGYYYNISFSGFATKDALYVGMLRSSAYSNCFTRFYKYTP
ncbi:IPT/TIG domain-containing protein [Pontibacter flavimaris]|uniref:IPT/TIG domain-containing protein n=1 Tax=Pontibacter flavimaris TaxID=1797110 RepID=A0A1Q5PAF5_9BACT|nr:IPT/TIG domain-containing protein [Pontibacter flavimaris]OKL39208.1 hypothetical protein A3841_04505 [Pontibacter flavimaris]